MTVTDLSFTRTRHRARRIQAEATPESQRVAELSEMLADPRYAGWADELEQARAELVTLTATTVLAA